MTATDLTVVERVQAGAAWLDEHRPGWWHTINLDTLDIASCEVCILGQMFGFYGDAPWDARFDGPSFVGHLRGFHAAPDTHGRAEDADNAALTAAWRELVEDRRSGVTA